jgi:hypothetical protein
VELPSVRSARDYLEGREGGLVRVLVSTAGRAVIIAAGAWVAGVREPRRLVAAAVGGAVAIELFVLWYTAREVDGEHELEQLEHLERLKRAKATGK